MKLLYVIPGLGVGGGAERSLLDLAPGMVAAGIDLSIVYFHDRPSSAIEEFRALGIPVQRVDAPHLVGRVLALRRIIREQRPDLVHTTLFEADISGRLAAFGMPVKVITSLVSTAYEPQRRRDPSSSPWRVEVVRAAEAVSLRLRCDRVHANSHAVARSAVARLHVPPERITVVHRGRDPRRLRPLDSTRRAEVRHQLGIADDEILVVNVGRHEFPKDQLTLLEAVAEARRTHPEVRLAVAGREGPMTPRLRDACNRLELSDAVSLLGFRRDVAELLGAADVFACSSVLEGLPGSVIEAMAMRLPVVATAIAPVRELVDESCAILVATEDPMGMAEAINDVIDDPAGARRRADAAHQRFIDRFTIDASLAGMVELYRSVAAS